MLLAPGETFNSSIFVYIREVVSEWFLGILCLTTGILRITFIWVNGAVMRTPVFRGVGCCVGFSIWIGLIIGVYQSLFFEENGLKALPIMLAILPTCAVAELLSAIRCGSDAVIYEIEFKRKKQVSDFAGKPF